MLGKYEIVTIDGNNYDEWGGNATLTSSRLDQPNLRKRISILREVCLDVTDEKRALAEMVEREGIRMWASK